MSFAGYGAPGGRVTQQAVLEAYLPARLGADEILATVKAIVAELGASGPGDMGKVMGVAKQRLAGQADAGLTQWIHPRSFNSSRTMNREASDRPSEQSSRSIRSARRSNFQGTTSSSSGSSPGRRSG